MDELGWPWPKHACFDDEPRWFAYLRSIREARDPREGLEKRADDFAGVVTAARRIRNFRRNSPAIALEIDGGDAGKKYVAIPGNTTAKYHLGSIAVVRPSLEKVVTSQHREEALLATDVDPALLED